MLWASVATTIAQEGVDRRELHERKGRFGAAAATGKVEHSHRV
jgi:hypothetical protein